MKEFPGNISKHLKSSCCSLFAAKVDNNKYTSDYYQPYYLTFTDLNRLFLLSAQQVLPAPDLSRQTPGNHR